MSPHSITVPAFLKIVLFKAKKSFTTIGFLFLLAGILELLSLAALLPVLLNLLGMSSDLGAANEIMSKIGLSGLSLPYAITVVLIFMSLRGGILFFADYWVARVACNIEMDTKKRLFNVIMYANWEHLMSLSKGDSANLILRESEKYSIAIRRLAELMSSILIATILISSSIFVSWQAFLIFLFATAPYLFLTRFINKKISVNARARVREANNTSKQIGESNSQLKYIKASGLEKTVKIGFNQSVLAYAHYFLKLVFYKAIIKHFPEVLGIIILGFLITFAHGSLGQSPTDIVFFLLLLFRGYRQLASVQSILAAVLENIPSYEACETLIENAKIYQESYEGKILENKKITHLEIQNLSFSYKNSDIKILDNISLSIPPTGLIALVGLSGAGKTTLSDILLGLLAPQSGDVILNKKHKLSDLNLQSWRNMIGYVPQESFLISGTIRKNILLGSDDQSDTNLYRVAQLAHIDNFISQLPEQYETDIGDFGARLSGGQRQRIALARALARNPSLLILDEATSALDNQTEQEIQKTIDDVSQKIPTIVIAHRLSTIKSADAIYVLNNGKIQESGSYQQLMAQDGLFSKMHKLIE